MMLHNRPVMVKTLIKYIYSSVFSHFLRDRWYFWNKVLFFFFSFQILYFLSSAVTTSPCRCHLRHPPPVWTSSVIQNRDTGDTVEAVGAIPASALDHEEQVDGDNGGDIAGDGKRGTSDTVVVILASLLATST